MTKMPDKKLTDRDRLIELIEQAEGLKNNDFPSVEEIADCLIAHGVTVQEWYSASEPPKDTYEYWIAYKACGDYFYSTGYFDGKCWRSAITHKSIPVTHWTHFPQPPKGE